MVELVIYLAVRLGWVLT